MNEHESARYIQEHPVPHPDFDAFVATIAALRAPDGCPWDRVQSHRSIGSNMVEEAYEALDAIEADDVAHMREELGDVLLQVVLQSQIASDAGEFTIDEVAADINAKMLRRHPHVFGDAVAENAEEVLDLWDKVKLGEAAAKAETSASVSAGAPDSSSSEAGEKPVSLLDSVPVSFPALLQAQKISRKAVSAGFEWDSLDEVWSQVDEEKSELIEAYARATKSENGKIVADGSAEAEAVALEFGDLLFALVNVARKMGIDAEGALRASNAKFRRRWAAMEAAAAREGKRIDEFDTIAQNKLWDEVKAGE